MDIKKYNSTCPSCKNGLSQGEMDNGKCSQCSYEFSPKQRKLAEQKPEIYLQDINLGNGEIRKVIEMADGRIEGEILALHGVWAVTDFGVECLDQAYFVHKSRFNESDWVSHMSVKTWVNINDFSKALTQAKAELA